MASWVLPALGGIASATTPASSSDPTYHYFHTAADLFNPGIVLAGACNGQEKSGDKSKVALDFGEGYTGECSGPYSVATTTAPFKGPTYSGVSWTARSTGGFDLTVKAYTTTGGLTDYGSISGWLSDRSSGDFHVTSAGAGVWHGDSTIHTPDVPGAAAGTRGGPLSISVHAYHQTFKPHIDIDISGYLLYSTPPPPREYHFFRVHFNGFCAGTYGLGTSTCIGHYDNGSSPGFADEDGTLLWHVVEGSRFLLSFATEHGLVVCDMQDPGKAECRDVQVHVDSLGAQGTIYTGDGKGGKNPTGTPGGDLYVNADGGGNVDVHGFLSYESWVPTVWPPG
jgi:hypothetical protein